MTPRDDRKGMAESPPDISSFVRLLGELDHSEFETFVTDLWAARGWEVSAAEGVVRMRRDEPVGERRTVAVLPVGSTATALVEGVDIVVTRAPDSGRAASTARELEATLIDTTDLYRLSLYGIDRRDADALFRSHFDRPLGEGRRRPDRSGSVMPTDRQPTSSWRTSRWSGVLAAAVVALGIAVVIGTASGPLGALEGDSGPPRAVAANGTDEPNSDQLSVTPVPLPTTVVAQDESGPLVDDSRYLDLQPTCDRPPAMVVSIILGALRHDGASTERRIETAWRFAVSPVRSSNGYRLFVEYLQQDAYDPLFTHQAVEFARLVQHTDTIVTQRVTLTTEGNRVDYEFALSKASGGSDAGCWQLAGITGPTSD